MLNKLSNICNSRLQTYQAPYVEYSIFYIFFSVFPYLLWKEDNTELSFILKFIGGSLCSVLLVKEVWLDRFKVFFGLYWYLTLFFCLPFTNIVILVGNQFADWSLINTSVSILVLASLVDWLFFIVLLKCAILLAIICFILANCISEITLIFSDQIIWAVYILILSIVTSFIFIRKRENINNIRIEVARNIAGVICHEIRNPIATLNLINQNFTKLLSNSYNNELNEFPKKVTIVLSEINLLIEDILIKLQEHNVIPLVQLKARFEIESHISSYPFKKGEMQKLDLKITSDFKFLGDSRLFKHIVFNLIKNSMYHTHSKQNGKLIISHFSEEHFNCLIFEDNGNGIDDKDLPYIFNSFYTKRDNGVGLGLYFCDIVMKKFGGKIHCDSQKAKYTKFILKFPKPVI